MSRTTNEVLTEMLQHHKEITQVELKTTDFGRDEVISLYPVAGAIASFEALLDNIRDDFHPGSSSVEGLVKHLARRNLPSRIDPQKSSGRLKIFGTNGLEVNIGVTAKRKLDGKIYVCTQDGVITSGEVICTFESSQSGQEYNIDSIGEEFILINPVAGITPTAVNTEQFRGGRNLETPGEMLQRVQDFDRRSNTGGNLPAYEQWAREASPLVVSSKSVKHPRGVSTVDTVITSGTTDIDSAVDLGLDITRLPSNDLLDIVQAYIEIKKPTTDDHLTIAPTEDNFNTTIIIRVIDESVRGKVEFEITKVWKKFIYKAKSGSRLSPTDLEKLIDSKVGFLLSFRRVEDFGEETYYFDIPGNKILVPNILTFSDP